jgi:hypothetical protein
MNRMHSTADVREAGRSPTFESYSDVERHIARANSLRAEVTAQMRRRLPEYGRRAVHPRGQVAAAAADIRCSDALQRSHARRYRDRA